MLAIERRNLIYNKIQTDKKVVVSELSLMFNVSEETIRRDLDKLEREGLVIKSYGGAVINDATNIDLPFNINNKNNVRGKQEIARIVTKMIGSGEQIMLDSSTTAVFIAKALKEKENLTVVTNSIEVMLELKDMNNWNIISPGGVLQNRKMVLVGSKTIEGISTYNVEKTIVSCDAFDLKRGFFDSNEEVSYAKQMMLRSGKERILAVDSSKFEKVSFSKVGDLKDIDVIVTDKKPNRDILKTLEMEKIRCLYPAEDETMERGRLYAEALFGN